MRRWTLDDALNLVRALQEPARKYNYHVCLGGGVLNKGHSDKDVDVYFLSLSGTKASPDIKGLLEWLSDIWGEPDEIPNYRDEHRFNPAPTQLGLGAVGLTTSPEPPVLSRTPVVPVRSSTGAQEYWWTPSVSTSAGASLANRGLAAADRELANRAAAAADRELESVFLQRTTGSNSQPTQPPAQDAQTKPDTTLNPYVKSLKFFRDEGERIDVFILGG